MIQLERRMATPSVASTSTSTHCDISTLSPRRRPRKGATGLATTSTRMRLPPRAPLLSSPSSVAAVSPSVVVVDSADAKLFWELNNDNDNYSSQSSFDVSTLLLDGESKQQQQHHQELQQLQQHLPQQEQQACSADMLPLKQQAVVVDTEFRIRPYDTSSSGDKTPTTYQSSASDTATTAAERDQNDMLRDDSQLQQSTATKKSSSNGTEKKVKKKKKTRKPRKKQVRFCHNQRNIVHHVPNTVDLVKDYLISEGGMTSSISDLISIDDPLILLGKKKVGNDSDKKDDKKQASAAATTATTIAVVSVCSDLVKTTNTTVMKEEEEATITQSSSSMTSLASSIDDDLKCSIHLSSLNLNDVVTSSQEEENDDSDSSDEDDPLTQDAMKVLWYTTGAYLRMKDEMKRTLIKHSKGQLSLEEILVEEEVVILDEESEVGAYDKSVGVNVVVSEDDSTTNENYTIGNNKTTMTGSPGTTNQQIYCMRGLEPRTKFGSRRRKANRKLAFNAVWDVQVEHWKEYGDDTTADIVDIAMKYSPKVKHCRYNALQLAKQDELYVIEHVRKEEIGM